MDLDFIKQTRAEQHSSPRSPCARLDAILVINLNKRKDRWTHVQKTLKLISPIAKEIIRIEAVDCDPGSKGCALSHLKALKLAQDRQFQNVLVLEDDAMLDIEPSKFILRINTTLAELALSYDVVICGSENNAPTIEPGVTHRKLKSSHTHVQTTVAYMIHVSYVPILASVWKECAQHLTKNMDEAQYFKYAIDQVWKQLFPLHNWYWLEGNLIRQRPDFSDIRGTVVSYHQPLRLSKQVRKDLNLL